MKTTDAPEMIFAARSDFRLWLAENAPISEGVWLIFGKPKAVKTLSAKDALEEALCFGWIDAQFKSSLRRAQRLFLKCLIF